MKPERKPTVSTPVPDGAITAENYLARAQAFIKARGYGVVIRTAECESKHAKDYPITEAQWHAWMSYFEAVGVKCAFLRKHGLATVPTNWPEEFDTAAEPSDRYYVPPPKPQAYYGRSMNVAHGLQRMADALPSAERRGPKPMSPSDRMAYLDSLREKYEQNPLPDCSALMKREGE